MAEIVDISVQPAGNPDSNGNGKGVRFNEDNWHYSYATGIAAMAIAASTHPEAVVSVPGSPVDGWTYGDVVEDVVDYFAFGQTEGDPYRGGWGYYENYGWSDNSNTGYVVLGLIYANTPLPHGFGLPIPQFVKDELNIWIDYIQNDVDGDANDGGSGYENPGSWVNILKTGTLLQEMAFVGDTLATPRVEAALEYIERHWNDPGVDPGWKGGDGYPVHKQAMYTTMKGFEAFSINLIDTDGDGDRDDDWFNEFADALLAEQALFPEGHWDWDYWAADYVLPTCWALLVLERAAPPVAKYDLTVHVKNSITGDPISGARVDVTGPESRTDYTDATGTVVFDDLLAGDYTVTASADGYYTESILVHLDEDKEIEIALRPIEVGVPEFPLGITVLMSLCGAIYILAKRKLKLE